MENHPLDCEHSPEFESTMVKVITECTEDITQADKETVQRLLKSS